MAIVYPSASGNWSDTSLWMEVGGNPYNQIPQIDDVVYLNGCTMTANMNINLGTNGEIRNDGDDGQGISAGGMITNSVVGRTVISNIYSYANLFSLTSQGNTAANKSIIIVGDIYCYGGICIFKSNSRYPNYDITGDVYGNGGVLATGSTTEGWFYLNGNIIITENSSSNYFIQNFVNRCEINGDIISDYVVFNNCKPLYVIGDISGDGVLVANTNSTIDLNGNTSINQIASAAITTLNITTCSSNILSAAAITNLNISTSYTQGTSKSFTTCTTLTCNGNLILSSIQFCDSITTLILNGTLTQGTGQIASYITTLNLDGTINLSGTRPFTYGVQNLNVATGGRVTYDQYEYFCFNNITAVDSNFEITCRNQKLDNFAMKNKNVLATTYPAQNKVSQDYVYGLEDEFTGTYQLPDPANVLDGTHYGSKVGTLTLDISSSVASTIDDLEDTAVALLDSQPPIVKVLSASQIGMTTATINLSTQNTGATTTKTGVDLDIDWNFTNPLSFETAGVVSSISVTGLNGARQYYVRGWVLDGGTKVYSKNVITLQTLLLPSELQLCEYIQTDGSAYVIIDNVIGNNIYTCECKCYCNVNSRYIFKCFGSAASERFDLTTQPNGKYNSRIFQNANTSSNVNRGNIVTFSFDRRNKKVKFNTQEISFSHTLNSNNGVLTLFASSEIASGTQIYYWKGNAWNIVSTYIKSGETYEDNKGNICSAGTAGFYDIINHIFYTNDGGGTLGHGNDII